MNKNTITDLILIGILLIGFSLLSRPSEEQIVAQKRYYDSIAVVQQQEGALKARTEATLANEKEETAIDSVSLFPNAAQGKGAFITIQNDLVEITLDNKGGRVYSALLKNYIGQNKKSVMLFNGSDTSMDFSSYNEKGAPQTKNFYFEAVNKTDSGVTVRLAADSASYTDFAYTSKPDDYLTSFMIRATGMRGKLAATINYVDILQLQHVRQTEKGYTYESRSADLAYKHIGGDMDNLSTNKDDEKSVPERLDWIIPKSQFFSSIFTTRQSFKKTTVRSKMEKQGSDYAKGYSAEMSTFFDPTGKQPTDIYFYFGPNHYETLTALDKGHEEKWELSNLTYLGWPLIQWASKWIIINVFDWLPDWELDMDVVLLLLIIMAKVAVFPTTWKAYMSSAKVRVLKPGVDEINRRYPKQEDAIRKQREVMRLYNQYDISPMGGCSSMLVQLPALMILFMFVSNAIEFRQRSFLWVDDLSTYDTFITFPLHVPLLGSHLNLFCLLMTITNILNTRYIMQQQDAGTQSRMTAMKWMVYLIPIMFLFALNDYPSGLNYYYLISTLIGVITMIILHRTTDEDKLPADLEAKKKSPEQIEKTGSVARLETMQKQQEQVTEERTNKQNKR